MPTDESPAVEAADYCSALVRERNIDCYLSTMFLPADARRDVYALYAFDAEIAHIRSMIKEPMMGEIRLQWWRDIIGGERAGEAANNPVASELLRAIAANNLPAMGFDNYLKARIFDLYDDPMPDTGTFEGYAGETTSFLLYQITTILNGSSAVFLSGNVADCAGHAGVAMAYVGVLKNMPLHRSRHQCFVPADIFEKANITIEEYFLADDDSLMARLIAELVAAARNHYQQFLEHYSGLPAELKAAFLPMCLVPAYLVRFEKDAKKAGKHQVDIAQWRKQIYLWRVGRSGIS